MARLRLIRSSDPRALLKAAADGFLIRQSAHEVRETFPSVSYLLAVRQGGLRDDVLSLAAAEGVAGWFDPPLCLFQQLHEWLGSTARRPCGDYERLVLLSRLLSASAQRLFSRLARPDAFVDAVDRLFGELAAEGVEPDVFGAAMKARIDRDAFERDRDADLGALYRAYTDALENGWPASGGERPDPVPRRDGRDGLIDCARAVRDDPAALEERLAGRREIRVFGLQDLRGGWPVLLRALRDSPALDDVVLYSCVSGDAFDGIQADAVEWMGRTNRFASRLFASSHAPDAGTRAAPPALSLICAPDPDRETEEVARRVRALIDAGVAPERIAVVSRSARPYVDRVVDALRLYGVPATARQRHRFAEIPVVRGVLSLFSVAADGWTRHGLVELAEQPYFGRMTEDDAASPRIDAVVINHIGYRRRVSGLDGWIEAHGALLVAARDHEERLKSGEPEERRGRDVPPPAARVETAGLAFDSFATQARDLDRARPLGAWVDWLREFLESDPWKVESRVYRVPGQLWDVGRIDSVGLRGMRQVVAEWDEALEAWPDDGAPIDVTAFESLLREMLSGDAALWTMTRRGVHVTEGLAVAQRALDHVFIVGLSGDSFPLHSPGSPMLDDVDRTALVASGIPVLTRDAWESRERELFRTLVMAARESLTSSWPRADGMGAELAASAFVEELVIAAAGNEAWDALRTSFERGDEVIDLALVAPPDPGSSQAVGEPDRVLRAMYLRGSVVAAASLPLIRDAEQREYAAHAASIERVRGTGVLSPYNGMIEEPGLVAWLAGERLGEATHVWSATQLESYAKCPWAWFSQRLLRLDDLDDPDIDMNPIARGAILHDALRRFYDAAKQQIGGPVLLRASHLEWARPVLVTSLADAIDDAGSALWLGPPALHDTKRAELTRMLSAYLEWEVQHNEEMFASSRKNNAKILRTAVVDNELSFGGEPGSANEVVLDQGGARFRLRGTIDRIEVGVDERIDVPGNYVAAVDYKTSKYSAPGGGSKPAWDDGVVLQVPLYAHVLAATRPGTRVSRIEYRAVKQRETVHSLELVQIQKKGLVPIPVAETRMREALEAAGRHVVRARNGEFPASPAPSCGCPPYCHAWDICRVRGGPRTSW